MQFFTKRKVLMVKSKLNARSLLALSLFKREGRDFSSQVIQHVRDGVGAETSKIIFEKFFERNNFDLALQVVSIAGLTIDPSIVEQKFNELYSQKDILNVTALSHYFDRALTQEEVDLLFRQRPIVFQYGFGRSYLYLKPSVHVVVFVIRGYLAKDDATSIRHLLRADQAVYSSVYIDQIIDSLGFSVELVPTHSLLAQLGASQSKRDDLVVYATGHCAKEVCLNLIQEIGFSGRVHNKVAENMTCRGYVTEIGQFEEIFGLEPTSAQVNLMAEAVIEGGHITGSTESSLGRKFTAEEWQKIIQGLMNKGMLSQAIQFASVERDGEDICRRLHEQIVASKNFWLAKNSAGKFFGRELNDKELLALMQD